MHYTAFLSTLWKTWLRDLMVIAALIFAARSAIADWNVVPTGSMKPTIVEGDVIFVNKLAYDLKIPFTTVHIAQWSNPSHGDIVVFFAPDDGTRMVKRVIGIPGDTVELRNNQLIINGKTLDYASLADPEPVQAMSQHERDQAIFALEDLFGKNHTVMSLPQKPAMRSFEAVRVPVDKYLVLGDNRDNSGDSRYFGFVDRAQIVGSATTVLISWDQEKFWLPRMKRFLRPLL